MGIFRALNFALYEDREGERVFNRGRQIEKDTYPQNKMYIAFNKKIDKWFHCHIKIQYSVTLMSHLNAK